MMWSEEKNVAPANALSIEVCTATDSMIRGNLKGFIVSENLKGDLNR
jgi:hypothetical protein